MFRAIGQVFKVFEIANEKAKIDGQTADGRVITYTRVSYWETRWSMLTFVMNTGKLVTNS